MWTETGKEGRHQMDVKREIRVMVLQAKEHQRLPRVHQKPERHLEQAFSSQPSEGTNAASTLILGFQSPEL